MERTREQQSIERAPLPTYGARISPLHTSEALGGGGGGKAEEEREREHVSVVKSSATRENARSAPLCTFRQFDVYMYRSNCRRVYMHSPP